MLLRDGLLELLYPTRCAGCDYPGTLLCDACRDELALIPREEACPRCGAPFGAIVCTECWDMAFAFEAAASVGVLERPLSRCVTLFKDGGERRLAGVLASLMAAHAGDWASWAESIVPVPATRKAVVRRGFDHCALLAAALARELGVPRSDLLERADAEDQRGLGRAARLTHAGSGWRVRAGVVVPSRILLVDDVLTTGATADAAAGILLGAGADAVRVGTIARAW